MTKILDTIKKPNVWFIICVVYIWLFGLAKLFATIGPSYLIARIADANNTISIAALVKAFLVYVHEASNRLGYKYEYILSAFVANIVIFMPIVILGYFVLRKKLWALNAMIILVVLYIVLSASLGLLMSESVQAVLNLNTASLVAVIYVFMRKSTRALFNKRSIE